MARDPADVYGRWAETYAESNPASPARGDYEWPAVKELLPDLDGRRILDAACGSGHYAARFADQGADVLGIDASREMIDVARQRHGDAADFAVGDLREPLGIRPGSIDLIVCQLVLEHIEDWHPVMASFAETLAEGGQLVLSTDHPFTTYFVIDHEPDDVGAAQANQAVYHEVEEYRRD